MPKIKSHKGTAKRVKKSATGKLIRERAFTGHFMAKKSASRKRNNSRSHSVSNHDNSRVNRALGK